MVKQGIFTALDFYILRTTILPTDIFKNKLISFNEPLLENLWELAQKPLIREAIAVSSISLLDSLTYLSPDSPIHKREQVARSFLRYLIRMSTRPTPFGLFSGVAYGEYGIDYKFNLSSKEHYKKRTRPDMEWILKIIAKLENDPKVISQLLITTNTMYYEAGDRTYLPYLTRIGNKKNDANCEIERISVCTTSAVKQVLEFAKKPLIFEELVSKLKEEYPDQSHEKIRDFIWQLFKQELLISNLRPPLLDQNPLSYLLNCLDNIKGIEMLRSDLLEISNMIDAYDRIPLGQGEDFYRNILEKMSKVMDNKNFLQVDLNIKTDSISLPTSLKEQIERVADMLWKISDDELGLSHMKKYRDEFIEKYGMSREVPILELLDEDIGLGAPPTYEYPYSRLKQDQNITPFQQRKKHLLSQWLMKVLLNGEKELVLDDDKVEELANNDIDTRYAPYSFEMYFSLFGKSKKSIEEGQYLLISGPTSLSYGAGKSIGRFVDIMDEKLNEYIKNINILEQEICEDVVIAELAYLPIDGRAANVVLTYNNRNYEIAMGTTPSKEKENTIELSDLVVGINENGLYLRSLKLGKEVIAVTNHMLNTSNAPNVYRFLRELSHERQRNIEMFNWGELNSLPFLPRVRYEQCILSPARWFLNEQTFIFKENKSKDEWINKFKIYKKEWKLPRYVYLTQIDNRLLLDLNDNDHIDEIRREFIKNSLGQGIVLTELGYNLEELHNGDYESYCTEFVFPIIKNSKESNRDKIFKKQYKIINYADRLKFPGSDCMFIKWYGISNRIDEFLSGQLREFCNKAQQYSWIKSSFFMRYADPSEHIRIRFFGEPNRLQNDLFPQINKFANECLQEGLISRMVIDTYDPEIERYGGYELIGVAEQWFCIDSQIVMDWIKLNEEGELPINKDLLAVISIIDIMEQLGINFNEQLDFLDGVVNYKKHLDLFRSHRAIYTKLCDSRDEFANLRDHEAGKFILPAFQFRSKILNFYGIKLLDKEKSEGFYVKRIDVINSIIHMHINRLYGINRDDEIRVLTLARHTIHNLQYSRRR